MAAPDVQAEISNAINALERRLSLDPLNESESRVDDERIAFERPLAVILSVDSAAMIVTILDAWLYE
jgi:hypothetical protein